MSLTVKKSTAGRHTASINKKEISSTSDVQQVIKELAVGHNISELEMSERIIQGILGAFDTNTVINY